MSIQIDDKNGWFFPEPQANRMHDITVDDLNTLMMVAEADNQRAEQVRQEVIARDQEIRDGSWRNKPRRDWLLEEFQILNTAGTVVQFPYGLRAITFPSKRHIYRGENKKYPETVPSLNRALKNFEAPKEKELYRVIAHLRKWQFASLIWQINVVPYWEAKLCDVNFDALVQHYGFNTHLLDLTNDFKTALFFATCKYDKETNSFLPLTEEDINESEETKYGFIYHAPDWIIDYFNGGGFMNWSDQHLHIEQMKPGERRRFYLQSGDMDGVAMQVGYQPLYRCGFQNAYIYPMRNEPSLQENWHFEKMRFKQSAELSKQVYEMMDRGKKVYPNEGLSELKDIIKELKQTVVFSMADLRTSYELDGIDKNLFPTIDDLYSAIQGFETKEGKIKIRDEEVVYKIPQELLDNVNEQYDGKDLLEQIGGTPHQKYPDQEYRNQRCIEIYGELI